jgi:hypothetical protein
MMDIGAHHEDDGIVPTNLFEAFEAASRRHQVAGFWALSEVDRVLISIWMLEADVNNGGFHQYYFNSAGDTAYYAPTAMRAIGARAIADIVERANARFGPDGPPKGRNVRQEALFALPDSLGLWADLDLQFFAYPDDLAMLLEQFLESNS